MTYVPVSKLELHSLLKAQYINTRIENVRTFLGQAKLLMDKYLLHNNDIFLITAGGS